MRATARANTNIALVKYWGKRDAELNLPARGSVSLTLEGLSSTTTVTFGADAGAGAGADADELILDGAAAGDHALRKALRVVDAVRARVALAAPVRIESRNSFPTGAGLASSASGLAALAVAAARAVGLDLPPRELSVLARLGSGSACRSVLGGFVEWAAGSAADGSDSFARQLHPPEHWDLRGVVAIVAEEPKAVASSAGMTRTGQSSPYHAAFLDQVDGDLREVRAAIAARDLGALGRIAERSCLRMHAAMMAADPPLIYLRPESWQVIDAARRLRDAGTPLFFTADAGPNVKIFCEAEAATIVARTLGALPGVRRLIEARPGGAAELLG